MKVNHVAPIGAQVLEVIYSLPVESFKRAFSFCEENRDINERDVKQIVDGYKVTGIIEPIIINDNNNKMLDGHHRTYACEILGIDVPFYFVHPLSDDHQEILRIMNIAKRNWNMRNFAQSAGKNHNPNYEKLVEFAREYGLVDKSGVPKFRILSAYVGRDLESIIKSVRVNYDALFFTEKEWRKIHKNAQSIAAISKEFAKRKITINNMAAFCNGWMEFSKSETFEHLVLSQRGEIRAIKYIAARFNCAFATTASPKQFIGGFKDAAK